MSQTLIERVTTFAENGEIVYTVKHNNEEVVSYVYPNQVDATARANETIEDIVQSYAGTATVPTVRYG